MSNETKTLYDRLGGYDAITAVANDLLPRLQADPQLGRFWAHRGEDGVKREKQLLIDFLCASAGGPMYYRGGTWCSSTEACTSVRATGTCSSVMQPQPWRSFRFPRPSNETWLRLSRVSRKRSSNNLLLVPRLARCFQHHSPLNLVLRAAVSPEINSTFGTRPPGETGSPRTKITYIEQSHLKACMSACGGYR